VLSSLVTLLPHQLEATGLDVKNLCNFSTAQTYAPS
jgi:hypothetical protein